jgi:hypothetical protein
LVPIEIESRSRWEITNVAKILGALNRSSGLPVYVALPLQLFRYFKFAKLRLIGEYGLRRRIDRWIRR